MNICGMNGDTTKHINRQQVLRLLSCEPGISRTEIASRMGLVKMTVSNIIAEMLSSGMICETEATGIEKPGAGRKLTGLCFSEKAPVLAGIHLSGTQLHAGIFSMELKLLGHSSLTVNLGDTVEQMASAVASLMDNISAPLLGVGMAFGAGWDPSLCILLQEKLNVPVFSCSDVAANAYAVSRSTAYKRYVCLSVAPTGPLPAPDAGVRAAAMVDGVLLGDRHGCIPLGQMTRNGGFLAESASIPAICRHISEALSNLCSSLADVQEACRNYPAGNAALCNIFSSLTDTVCNICLAVRPEALIIDHSLAGFGDELKDYFFSRLHMRLGDSAPVIAVSEYGAYATLFGSACLVLEKVFTDTLGYNLFFQN